MISFFKDLWKKDKEVKEAYKSYKKGEMSKEEYVNIKKIRNKKSLKLIIVFSVLALIFNIIFSSNKDYNCYGSFEQDVEILKVEMPKKSRYLATKYVGLDFEYFRYEWIRAAGTLRKHLLKEHREEMSSEEISRYEADVRQSIIGLDVFGTKIGKSKEEIEKDIQIVMNGENAKKFGDGLLDY